MKQRRQPDALADAGSSGKKIARREAAAGHTTSQQAGHEKPCPRKHDTIQYKFPMTDGRTLWYAGRVRSRCTKSQDDWFQVEFEDGVLNVLMRAADEGTAWRFAPEDASDEEIEETAVAAPAENEANEWEVGAILAKGLSDDGRVLYNIRWRGCGPEQDTWEPVSNLGGAEALIAAYERIAIPEVARPDPS